MTSPDLDPEPDMPLPTPSDPGETNTHRPHAPVSDARASDETLRASEARYRALATASADVIYRMSPDWREIQQLDGGGNFVGTPEPHATWLEASIAPEDQPHVSALIAEAMRSETPFELEHRVRHPDGSLGWTRLCAVPVRNDRGEVVEWIGTASDITTKKAAQVQVRESEQRYRRIVEQATDYAIFSTDAGRRIESWSPGAEATFGWTADEAVGQLMDVTYTPEDRAAGVPEREAAQTQRDGQAPNVRWHQRQDGSRVFIEGMAYARYAADGTFQGIFKVGQDVTERVLADEARRAAETTHREDLEAEVVGVHLDLRALSRRLLIVQEEERRRLALELHDEIGQVLTGLTFQIAAAQAQRDETALHAANTTVQRLTDQVRQLALNLRPQVLDHYGLFVAVQWHVERFQATTGITIHLRELEVAQERYAPEVEIAAFRIVQEALTNIARYAEVEEAWVTLIRDDTLFLVIYDHGRGFDPTYHRESSGLGGMRERVALLGGRFVLETAPGQGVHITAEFPLDAGERPSSGEEMGA